MGIHLAQKGHAILVFPNERELRDHLGKGSKKLGIHSSPKHDFQKAVAAFIAAEFMHNMAHARNGGGVVFKPGNGCTARDIADFYNRMVAHLNG